MLSYSPARWRDVRAVRWAHFKGRRPAPSNADAIRPTGRGRLRALLERKEGGRAGWWSGGLYVLRFPRNVRAEVTERTKVASLAAAATFAKGARSSNRNK